LGKKIIIEYCGGIQYETIGELIHKFKKKVHINGIQIGTYKRLLLIMIESLENIMKHSEAPSNLPNDNHYFTPAFSIYQTNEQFIIAFSNPIRRVNITSLTHKINYLNTLNQEDLKEFYKQTITNGGVYQSRWRRARSY